MERNNGKKHKEIFRRAFAAAGAFFLLLWLIFPAFPSLSTFAVSAADGAKEKELLLASYTTRFSESNEARAHNIRLACRKIDGYRLGAGGEFSFNAVVGARTKERGFLDAAVILDGEFVPGTGGGVCQVSTTLYNAALLSGMEIIQVRAHSLRVGYVPPSFDAMVSSASDLRFVNPKSTPAVIRARAKEGSITVELYGKKDGYTYRAESVVLREILPPAPIVREGDCDKVLKEEKNGLKSEGYLLVYRRGKRVGGRRIRRDTYAYVQGEIQKKREKKGEEEGTEKIEEENDLIFDGESRKFAQNN